MGLPNFCPYATITIAQRGRLAGIALAVIVVLDVFVAVKKQSYPERFLPVGGIATEVHHARPGREARMKPYDVLEF